MSDETPGKLAGLRIAVTREKRAELASMLEAEGAKVAHCPLTRTVPPRDAHELADCVERQYDWVVFTSVRAVRMLERIEGRTPCACVGESTAAAAREAGWNVELIPERRHVKGMIEAFAALKQSGRVLYPRSEIAPGTLKEGLQALGYQVDDPVAYRTVPDEEGMMQFVEAVENGLDAVVFASPSAVRSAAAAGNDRLAGLRIYSIGPTTSAAIRDAGCEVTAEARGHNVQSLVEAIIEAEQRHG